MGPCCPFLKNKATTTSDQIPTGSNNSARYTLIFGRSSKEKKKTFTGRVRCRIKARADAPCLSLNGGAQQSLFCREFPVELRDAHKKKKEIYSTAAAVAGRNVLAWCMYVQHPTDGGLYITRGRGIYYDVWVSLSIRIELSILYTRALCICVHVSSSGRRISGLL